MPSTSKKQRNFMAAAAHDPAFAKRVGISQKVATEFNQADKGKKFRGGGMAKKMFGGKETPAEEMKEATALKSGRISKQQYVAGEKSEGHGAGAAKKASAIKSGRLSPQAYAKEHKAEGMKCGGKVKKMAGGGAVAMPKGKDMGSMNMKKGGCVKMTRGGGVARKGVGRGKVC